MKQWDDFDNIWVVDYEFISGNGDPQQPICYVAYNLRTKQLIRYWISDESSAELLYSGDTRSLIVAFAASAEFGCHVALNFPMPIYCVDLYAEFKNRINGLQVDSSLIGACNYFNLPSTSVHHKDTMRKRVLQGPPYTEKEQPKILDYCQEDVVMTTNLFEAMQPSIELEYALLRGRYMQSVAFMEHCGIPINTTMLKKLQDNWEMLKLHLIEQVNKQYDVYEGTTFKLDKFEKYLIEHDIPVEYTPTGRPQTGDDYLKELAKVYPEIGPLQALKFTIGKLKLTSYTPGQDGRLRTSLMPFRSKTARNYPKKYIFGNAVWTRNLIKPESGTALAYIDYSQQELAIAAALSQDINLIAAYKSGDPYTTFAKFAGAIPPEGSKHTHSEVREVYKTLMLGTNYGLSERAFALKANITLAEAHRIMKVHKYTYRRYWDWSDDFVGIGYLSGRVKTNYHWYMYTKYQRPNTLKNWPMQSTGADILRLAVNLCIQNGLKVIAPVHDAILIEASTEQIEDHIKIARKCMKDASVWVVGLEIGTDVKVFCYPESFSDARGDVIWKIIIDGLQKIEETGQ